MPITMKRATTASAGSKSRKAPVRQAWQRVSTVTDIAGYVVIAVSVIVGLLLARTQDAACSALSVDCSLLDQYPPLPAGIGAAFDGVLRGLLVILIACYVDARATDATREPFSSLTSEPPLK